MRCVELLDAVPTLAFVTSPQPSIVDDHAAEERYVNIGPVLLIKGATTPIAITARLFMSSSASAMAALTAPSRVKPECRANKIAEACKMPWRLPPTHA